MSYGLTPRVPGAPEPRMYPRSGYFLVFSKLIKIEKFVNMILIFVQDKDIIF